MCARQHNLLLILSGQLLDCCKEAFRNKLFKLRRRRPEEESLLSIFKLKLIIRLVELYNIQVLCLKCC